MIMSSTEVVSQPDLLPSLGNTPPVSPSTKHRSSSLEVTIMCTECSSTASNIIQDFGSGSLLCGDCGETINDRLINPRAKWRTIQKGRRSMNEPKACIVESIEKNTATLALVALRQVSSIDTSKSLQQTDATRPSAASKASIQRHERNLARALSEITRMCSTVDLPKSISERAWRLYQKVEEQNLHRGKSIDTIIAACIFLACRQECVPRTFKEICALAKVPRKDIGRTFKLLKEKLGASAGQMSLDDLMARFCSNLSLLKDVQECAIILCRKAKEFGTLAGKSPVSIAGACIFMASHLMAQPRDPKVISHVAGVSEVTIKNSYKLLFADKCHLVSDQMLAIDSVASIAYLPVP